MRTFTQNDPLTDAEFDRLGDSANDDLTETLGENELREAAYFDQILRRIEKEREDPDDVFLAAQARKRELQKQTKTLKDTLLRQRPKRKKH